MEVTPLEFTGLLLVKLPVFRDSRGFFTERFNAEAFAGHGLPARFAQDNHSHSLPGVLRGLHYQCNPAQGKLVGVICGRIWDVVVDLRRASATFGRSHGIELNDANGLQLWVPPGFAHGFCVLGAEPADVLYKVDGPYNPSGEGGVHWADPDLAISWPVKKPILSARDDKLGSLAAYRAAPVF